jgi:hypothetical protein
MWYTKIKKDKGDKKMTKFQSYGTWVKGREEFNEALDITFWAKVFTEGSHFGINGGKISKLMIKLGNETLCLYDRGWDIEPSEEVTPFYESILAQFN